MSCGNPVVSTGIGVEGIKATNRKHLLIPDGPKEFTKAIIYLLSDSQLFERLRVSARQLVEEEYDWEVVGVTMNKAINQILADHSNFRIR